MTSHDLGLTTLADEVPGVANAHFREEVHEDRDQFFRIEQGRGEIRIDGVANRVEDDFAVIVPAGARHNVINTGDGPLRLVTVYAPPEHAPGTVHQTKAEADAAEAAEH